MTRDQFTRLIDWWQLQDPPLRLPFGSMPGEEPGGGGPTFTEETWKAYRWNPPATSHPDGVRDDAASPKPTWAMLLEVLPQAELSAARQNALAELRIICNRQIMAAYRATTFQEEVLFRLRGAHSRAQDADRERLRALFHITAATINAAATTAAVESLLARARTDAFWAPPPPDPAA